MRVIVMEPGELIPAKPLELPKNWDRRALAAHIKKSPPTLYKWEEELHGSLKTLPYSFALWKVIIMQSGTKKHPPLDTYQIESIVLLAELRKSAPSNETIAETVKNNSAQFYTLHELYAPKTTNNNQGN